MCLLGRLRPPGLQQGRVGPNDFAGLPRPGAALTHMSRVGIRALQQNASAVVARAAGGEIVEITDRGRPVARLVPLAGNHLSLLVAAGLVRPARRRVADLPPPLPAVTGDRSLGDLLREARTTERWRPRPLL